MKTNLLYEKQVNVGTQKVYKFPNGYGASVVCGPYTYGGDKGLFEIAVLKFGDGERFSLTYETPITDDVLGHIAPADVEGILSQIAALPTKEG